MAPRKTAFKRNPPKLGPHPAPPDARQREPARRPGVDLQVPLASRPSRRTLADKVDSRHKYISGGDEMNSTPKPRRGRTPMRRYTPQPNQNKHQGRGCETTRARGGGTRTHTQSSTAARVGWAPGQPACWVIHRNSRRHRRHRSDKPGSPSVGPSLSLPESLGLSLPPSALQ